MPQLAARPTRMGAWLKQLLKRAYPDVGVVALAAKVARAIWAVLRRGEDLRAGRPRSRLMISNSGTALRAGRLTKSA